MGRQDFGRPSGGGRANPGEYSTYLNLVTRAERSLRPFFTARTIGGLLHGPRYTILATRGPVTGDDFLLATEIDRLVDDLRQAKKVLFEEFHRWSNDDQTPVFADTSFYMSHPVARFDEVNFVDVLGKDAAYVPTLVVPMLAVAELDRLKDLKDSARRGRARLSLAILDRVFRGVRLDKGVSEARLNENTWIELLMNPAEHEPLADPDEELVARAVAVQMVSSHTLVFLTYDTSQAFRARRAGLRVCHLRQVDDPPRFVRVE